MRHPDFYDLLQVRPDASVEVIKGAYRALAKVHHPDVGGDLEVMTQLNEALEVLTDPGRRAAYDRERLAKKHGEDWNSTSPPSEEAAPSPTAQAPVAANRRWWQGVGVVLACILLIVALIVRTQSGTSVHREPSAASIRQPTTPTPSEPANPATRTASTPVPPMTQSTSIKPTVPSGANEAPRETASAPTALADKFTLGSTKDQVRAVMGSPSSIVGSHWGYGLSSVEFGMESTVIGWSNIGGTLKVYLGDRQADAPPITLGSTRSQVVVAMGTPSSVIGAYWGFGLSHVEFGPQGTVTGWSDIEGNLRVRLGEQQAGAPGIGLGSTKADVVAAMGTPSSIIGNYWGYGLSRVEFGSQGTVVGWSNVAGNLKLR